MLGYVHFSFFAVSFHRIVEIREGQLTEEFDRFPYEEVEGQSFSLMFEEESKWGKKGEGRRGGEGGRGWRESEEGREGERGRESEGKEGEGGRGGREGREGRERRGRRVNGAREKEGGGRSREAEANLVQCCIFIALHTTTIDNL